MLSLICIIVYLLFCLRSKSETILCSFVFLLPLHELLGQLFVFYEGNEGLILSWRKVGILMFFVKVFFMEKHHKLQIPVLIISIVFVLLIFMYFIIGKMRGNENPFDGVSIYLSITLLLLSMSIVYFTEQSFDKLIKVIAFSVFINGVIGILQHFFFSIPIGLFMGHLEIINGSFRWVSSSFVIEGIERMRGIVGGPNSFGIYMSFSLAWLLLSLKTKKTKLYTVFYFLCFLLGLFCLLMSFSRAGWVIFAFIFICYEWKVGNSIAIIKYIVWSLFGFIIILGIIYIVFPESFDVYIATFTMQESSVASRGDMITDSYKTVLTNPLGLGLGGAKVEDGTWAESSFVLFAIECGIIGCAFFIIYISFILTKVLQNKKYHIVYFNSIVMLFISMVTGFVSINIIMWPYIYYFFAIMGLGINPSLKYICQNQYKNAKP